MKTTESKQNRKTPLTTIAISQESAQKLDEYLQGKVISRKEFVELSCDYFQRTGFDLRGSAFDLSPFEKLADRMDNTVSILEEKQINTEVIRLLLESVREQSNRQLPGPELIAKATEEKIKAESQITALQKDVTRLEKENEELKKWKETVMKELVRIQNEQKTIGKIKINIPL